MPAVIVGAASLWSGLGAVAAAGGWASLGAGLTGAAGWAGFGEALAVGASVVGGAASTLGAITGDKKLQNDGMMVGAIGGLGTLAMGTDALSANAAKTVASDAATKAATASSMDVTGKAGTTDFTNIDPVTGQVKMNTGGAQAPTFGQQPIGAAPQTPSTGVAGAVNPEVASLTAKYDKLIADNSRNNLIAQTVGGIGQGYQAKATADAAQARLDEEKRRYDQEYANRNNIGQLSIPKPVLPKLYQPNGMLQSTAPTTVMQPNIVLSNGAQGQQPLPQTVNPATLPKRTI